VVTSLPSATLDNSFQLSSALSSTTGLSANDVMEPIVIARRRWPIGPPDLAVMPKVPRWRPRGAKAAKTGGPSGSVERYWPGGI
jgi:hypothetical protein